MRKSLLVLIAFTFIMLVGCTTQGKLCDREESYITTGTYNETHPVNTTLCDNVTRLDYIKASECRNVTVETNGTQAGCTSSGLRFNEGYFQTSRSCASVYHETSTSLPVCLEAEVTCTFTLFNQDDTPGNWTYGMLLRNVSAPDIPLGNVTKTVAPKSSAEFLWSFKIPQPYGTAVDVMRLANNLTCYTSSMAAPKKEFCGTVPGPVNVTSTVCENVTRTVPTVREECKTETQMITEEKTGTIMKYRTVKVPC